MQTINVRTTQNVFISYAVASVGDRIAAFIIDALIMIAYAILAGFVLSETNINSIPVIYITLMLPLMLYHLLFEIFMDGQSPGKRQMSIKVVRLDGTPPTIGNYILRWLLRFVDITILSGGVAIIIIVVNGKGQRLGDMAAGTAVVKLGVPQASSSKAVFTTAEDDYTATFQQVTQLTDQDIEIIQQALAVNRTTGNSKPVLAVAEKIQRVLDIHTDLPPVKFLYTIVKDYSHLTSR